MVDALKQVWSFDSDQLRKHWTGVLGRRPCPGKVWARFLRLYKGPATFDQDTKPDGYQPKPIDVAWRMAWHYDAEDIRERCKDCGQQTLEIKWKDSKGATGVRYARDRCKNVRCKHCGVRVVGRKWKARLGQQATHDLKRGAGWMWVTLTVQPKAWAAAHGYPCHRTSATLAHRWIGPAFAGFIATLREEHQDVAYHRVVELHDSGWPHVHALIRSPMMEDEATSEASGRGRGDDWKSIAGYSLDQREQQRTAKAKGKRRRAICPFPSLRQHVKAIAIEHGFSEVIDVSPVMPTAAGMEGIASYLSKGPQAHGRAKRILDPKPSHDAIAGEMSKGRQRVDKVLARGVRCFEASRPGSYSLDGDEHDRPAFFDGVEAVERETSDTITDVRKVNIPIEAARALLASDWGEAVTGEAKAYDFRGEIPAPKQKRPIVLDGFCSNVSIVSEIQEEEHERRTSEGVDICAPHPDDPKEPPRIRLCSDPDG